MLLEIDLQEAQVLAKVLEGQISDIGVLIRHTRGFDAKELLKRRRRLMRRIVGRLSTLDTTTAVTTGTPTVTATAH